MQKRENYLYVGMDLHKDTHTAVLVNCWNEKLDVIVIRNKPSAKAHPCVIQLIPNWTNGCGYCLSKNVKR